MVILSSLVTILFLSRRHTYLSLSVLDSELDCDLQTFPVSGGLHDVLSNLLGGQTKGTNLGGQGGCGSHLSSDYAELDDLDFIGIKLGRHTVWLRLNLNIKEYFNTRKYSRINCEQSRCLHVNMR